MTVASFNVVFFTCIFVLPGFIIRGIISNLSPTRKQSDEHALVTCLAYSTVHYAVWSWLYLLLLPMHYKCTILFLILLVLTTLLGSLLVAVIIGVVKQKRIIQIVAKKLPINVFETIPTAWDYWFSKHEEAWLIITLVSGEQFYGKYSSRSFASSSEDGRDIYLEELYDFDDSAEEWLKREGCTGVIISGNGIRAIEILEGKEEEKA